MDYTCIRINLSVDDHSVEFIAFLSRCRDKVNSVVAILKRKKKFRQRNSNAKIHAQRHSNLLIPLRPVAASDSINGSVSFPIKPNNMPNEQEAAAESSSTTNHNAASTTGSSLSGTKYSLSRQKLNEIIKALRDCGTEEVTKLPKIVVIGNQSAGKSSVIEAISQIRLPRATSTCTRCPMEVILTSTPVQSEWHCKVSLRIEHQDVAEQTLDVIDFDETNKRGDVEQILRRAQLAILNPSQLPSTFIGLDEKQCDIHYREIGFSRNSVILEITGADVDVTFIDLPGIISNTERVHPLNLLG